MGLVSLIPKLINYGTKAVKVAYRGAKVSPNVIFSDGAHVFVNNAGKAARTAIKADKSFLTSMWEALKGGGKAVEASTAAAKAAKGGFLKQAWSAISKLPKSIATSTKAGARAARMAGKSQLLGGMKGVFKGIGKNMPLLGNILLVAMEVPNVIKAVKEQGLVQGAKEVVKAGARLGGASVGAAIGAAVGGPIGGIVGWIAGEWLTSKVVGKSYTEEQEEQQQAQVQDTGYNNPYMYQTQDPTLITINPNAYRPGQQSYTPYTFGATNPFGNGNNYDDDVMMKQLNLTA